MSIKITDSLSSADILQSINQTQSSLLQTMAKLSSGFRINQASDDPAGLVISLQLQASMGSLNQQIENTTLAISKYETADSTVTEMSNMLVDLRAQAISASNAGVNDQSALEAYQEAAQADQSSYNSLIETTVFNGSNLLNGGKGALVELTPLTEIDLSTPEKAQEAVAKIDAALMELDEAQNSIGSTRSIDLEARRSSLEITLQNITAAESSISGTDLVSEMTSYVRDEIKLQAGLALLAQDQKNQKAISLLLE